MMDLSILFTSEFLILALATAAIVFVIRKVVEFFLKEKRPKLYTELILPVMPVVIGCLLGFVAGPQAMLGLVAGLCSASAYKILKGMTKKASGDE